MKKRAMVMAVAAMMAAGALTHAEAVPRIPQVQLTQKPLKRPRQRKRARRPVQKHLVRSRYSRLVQ